MDLLEEQYNKNNEKNKSQKLIMKLIIILSVLLVIIIIGIVLSLMQGEREVPYQITINGQPFDTKDNAVIDFEGSKYIGIKKFTNTQGYDFFNGEYGIVNEDKTKCYVNTTLEIIGFEADSNEIYKVNDVLDNENFTLNKKIINYDNNLYIAVEDLEIAFNLYEDYNAKKNTTIIQTSDDFIESYSPKILEQKGAEIDKNTENLKAISYERIVVKKNNSYGILDFEFEEIVGPKYNSILFDECAQTFIISTNNGQYGILNMNGETIVNLIYDNIEILNYSPLLYKVKNDNKYGIMKEDGTLLTNIEYDQMGYPANASKDINHTLIVPEMDEGIKESIIVCKDRKYGLIEAETGNVLLPFNYEGIYSVTREDSQTKELKDYYFIQTEEQIYFLTDYMERYNKIIVNR